MKKEKDGESRTKQISEGDYSPSKLPSKYRASSGNGYWA